MKDLIRILRLMQRHERELVAIKGEVSARNVRNQMGIAVCCQCPLDECDIGNDLRCSIMTRHGKPTEKAIRLLQQNKIA